MKQSNYNFCNDLFTTYYQQLFKITISIFNDYELTQDALHETFLTACIQEKKLMEHPKPPGLRVLTAKNKGLEIRHKNAHYSPLSPEDTLLSEDNAPADDSVPELEYLLKDDSHYQILCLKYIYGYSIKEIARYYHISISACKMRLKRAKECIRMHLD